MAQGQGGLKPGDVVAFHTLPVGIRFVRTHYLGGWGAEVWTKWTSTSAECGRYLHSMAEAQFEGVKVVE